MLKNLTAFLIIWLQTFSGLAQPVISVSMEIEKASIGNLISILHDTAGTLTY